MQLLISPRSPSARGSSSRHVRNGQAKQVEAADQIDLDDLFELLERHRLAVAVDDAARAANPGAIDDDSGRTVLFVRRRNGTLRCLALGHITG